MKMGRPKIEPQQRKQRTVILRVSTAEREELDRATKGLKLSAWAREVLLREARQIQGQAVQ
jgi:hypothetical protein